MAILQYVIFSSFLRENYPYFQETCNKTNKNGTIKAKKLPTQNPFLYGVNVCTYYNIYKKEQYKAQNWCNKSVPLFVFFSL